MKEIPKLNSIMKAILSCNLGSISQYQPLTTSISGSKALRRMSSGDTFKLKNRKIKSQGLNTVNLNFFRTKSSFVWLKDVIGSV